MTSADASAAMAADSVDFIHEDDARSKFSRFAEHVADTAGADADEHFNKVRTGDEKERTGGFTGNGFGNKGFSSSWSADAKHAFRNASAECCELTWVFEKFNDLLEFFF